MTATSETDGRCTICVAVQQMATASGPESTTVVYLDDAIVALFDPDLLGFLLAPRTHVRALSTEPGPSAFVLAAVRKLVAEMQSAHGWSDVKITPMDEHLGSSGHVVYQVRQGSKEMGLPLALHDVRAQIQLFARLLGDRVNSGTLPLVL